MSTESKLVAIVTVTYNSKDFIKRFLESVSPVLTKLNQFILVCVDNASQDKTCEIITEFANSTDLQRKVYLVVESENLGFGRGCNKGVKFARQFSPDYLWFLNPDTTIDESAALSLLQFYDNYKQADFVGSVLRNSAGEMRSGAFRFPGLMTTLSSNLRLGLFDRVFSRFTISQPIPAEPAKADWLTGGSFVAKTNAFEALKGFDPNYFLYFEDIDFFLRAKRAGFTAWTCPESKVFHISGASTGINKQGDGFNRRPKYWFESRRYFYVKNFGRWYFALIDLAFFFSQLVWRMRVVIQKKEQVDPPYMLRDIFTHSAFSTENKVKSGSSPESLGK